MSNSFFCPMTSYHFLVLSHVRVHGFSFSLLSYMSLCRMYSLMLSLVGDLKLYFVFGVAGFIECPNMNGSNGI